MSAPRMMRSALVALVALGSSRIAAAQGDDIPEAVARAAEARAASEARPAADALVDRIIQDPGAERQLCGASDQPGCFRLYGFMRYDVRVEADRFVPCRAQRDAAIEVVRARLEASGGLPVAGQGRFTSGLEAWGHLLAIAIDLNATEVMPVLLRALAVTRLEPDREEQRAMLLSTLTALLRQERWPALLASDLEEAYRARIEHLHRKPPAGPRRYTILGADPLTGLVRGAEDGPQVEATDERVELIVRWCDALLTAPMTSRRGAQGMDPEPIDR